MIERYLRQLEADPENTELFLRAVSEMARQRVPQDVVCDFIESHLDRDTPPRVWLQAWMAAGEYEEALESLSAVLYRFFWGDLTEKQEFQHFKRLLEIYKLCSNSTEDTEAVSNVRESLFSVADGTRNCRIQKLASEFFGLDNYFPVDCDITFVNLNGKWMEVSDIKHVVKDSYNQSGKLNIYPEVFKITTKEDGKEYYLADSSKVRESVKFIEDPGVYLSIYSASEDPANQDEDEDWDEDEGYYYELWCHSGVTIEKEGPFENEEKAQEAGDKSLDSYLECSGYNFNYNRIVFYLSGHPALQTLEKLEEGCNANDMHKNTFSPGLAEHLEKEIRHDIYSRYRDINQLDIWEVEKEDE